MPSTTYVLHTQCISRTVQYLALKQYQHCASRNGYRGVVMRAVILLLVIIRVASAGLEEGLALDSSRLPLSSVSLDRFFYAIFPYGQETVVPRKGLPPTPHLLQGVGMLKGIYKNCLAHLSLPPCVRQHKSLQKAAQNYGSFFALGIPCTFATCASAYADQLMRDSPRLFRDM